MILAAWPSTSQTEGNAGKDSLKISYQDALSAALELAEKDRLALEVTALEGIIETYKAESLERELQRNVLKDQIGLQKKINQNLRTQNKALKEKGKRKLGLTEVLISILLFAGGLIAGG